MAKFICKCGKEIRKSSTAAVTGNVLKDYAPGHECYGCPYVVEQQKWLKYPEFEIVHECEATESVMHVTQANGFIPDHTRAVVYSLDFDFIQKVADHCVADEHLTINRESNGNVFGYKTCYCANGLYRLSVYTKANKAGIAAKMALFEKFFNDDGTRRDTGGADETEIVQALIVRGKELAKWESGEETMERKTENEANSSEASKESKTPPTEQPKQKTDVRDINVANMPEEIEASHHNTYSGLPYIFIGAEDPTRPEMLSIWAKEDTKPNQYAYVVHLCGDMPDKDYIWRSSTGGWYHSIGGNPQCVDVDCCPFCGCAFTNVGEGDVYIYRVEHEPYERKEETAVATDTNVGDKPEQPTEQTEPDNRSTLVASPLDAVGAALAPAFDYSIVDEDTAHVLEIAENRIVSAKRHYVVECASAVAMAHEALCENSSSPTVGRLHGNRYSENTFLAWCESVGLKKSTAYNFLQVDAMFLSASEAEKAILEQAPATLLYAAAKPSAPAELVEAVKSGDITTSAEYKKLLDEKNKREKTISELLSERQGNSEARAAAGIRAMKAEEQAQQAKADFDVLSEVVQKKGKENARLQREAFEASERERALERKIQEMESRPVEVAVQQPSAADIARYRKEGAAAANAEWQEKYEYIEAQNQGLNDTLKERTEALLEMPSVDYDAQEDTAAIIYEMGKRTAKTVECALALFFETAAQQPDVVYNPALQFLLDTHEKFTAAINTGKWFHDVEEVASDE